MKLSRIKPALYPVKVSVDTIKPMIQPHQAGANIYLVTPQSYQLILNRRHPAGEVIQPIGHVTAERRHNVGCLLSILMG